MQSEGLSMAQPTVRTAAAPTTITLDHGLACGTTVLTLDGILPVEFLTPGDRIVTRDGAQRLAAIEVTVVQNARVIRITEGTLGIDQPTGDMIVSPDQPILVRDWRAKALCGTSVALVPAAKLVDGEYIRAEVLTEVRFYALRFADEAVIYACGLELACAPDLTNA